MRYVLLVSIVVFLNSCCSVPVESIENMKISSSMLNGCSLQYGSFSQAARDEGLPNISNLFAAMSASERIMSNNYRNLLLDYVEGYNDSPTLEFKVRSTLENLKEAAAAEERMFQIIYPRFNAIAVGEGASQIESEFYHTAISSAKHANMFNHAARLLSDNATDSLIAASWPLCPECGFIYTKAEQPELCDNCYYPSDRFIVFY